MKWFWFDKMTKLAFIVKSSISCVLYARKKDAEKCHLRKIKFQLYLSSYLYHISELNVDTFTNCVNKFTYKVNLNCKWKLNNQLTC